MERVVIAGAGVVGLSLALDLRDRGCDVVVLEQGDAIRGASWAAAGMLAAHDPANPPELRDLAALSLRLYPDYLERVRALSRQAVPIETRWTLEGHAPLTAAWATQYPTSLAHLRSDSGFQLHPEQSLDPRKLTEALLSAATAAGAALRENAAVVQVDATAHGVCVQAGQESFAADAFVDCTGAWSRSDARPVKGQMLRVQLRPGSMHLEGCGNVVVRTPDVYVVPRLDGSALIGATVEDAGFDTAVSPQSLQDLRAAASRLVPALQTAAELESWAGLRPGSRDGLPILGQVAHRHFVATGLYRNGILLAPAVARLTAQALHGEAGGIDLQPFRPGRFNAPAPSLIAHG